MGRSSSPPMTTNPEAQALIDIAQRNCDGCRVNWRLVTGTFKHRTPSGLSECWAVRERTELRAIAAKGRK